MVSMPCANFFFTVAKSSTAPLFFASTSEGVLVYDVRVPRSAAGGDAACPDEGTGMLPRLPGRAGTTTGSNYFCAAGISSAPLGALDGSEHIGVQLCLHVYSPGEIAGFSTASSPHTWSMVVVGVDSEKISVWYLDKLDCTYIVYLPLSDPPSPLS